MKFEFVNKNGEATCLFCNAAVDTSGQQLNGGSRRYKCGSDMRFWNAARKVDVNIVGDACDSRFKRFVGKTVDFKLTYEVRSSSTVG